MPECGQFFTRGAPIFPLSGRGIAGANCSCMISLLLIIAALFAAGLFVELISASSAPLGYQDETGFHFGREHATSADPRQWENPS